MARRPTGIETADERPAMTYEEFLAWADEDTHAEWVEGEVVVFMPVSRAHQAIAVFLTTLLNLWLEATAAGQLYTAPFGMRLRGGRAHREPDLMVVGRGSLDRVRPLFLDGPADIAIEIVSNESVTRDRRDKMREYAEAGVKEYWLLDPRAGEASVAIYALAEDGRYEPALPDGAGRLHSTVLSGFWLDPAWLAQDPLPGPLSTFRLITADAAHPSSAIDETGS